MFDRIELKTENSSEFIDCFLEQSVCVPTALTILSILPTYLNDHDGILNLDLLSW